MQQRHVIRLRGPWRDQRLGQAEPLPGGGVRYTRRFNQPTGIEPDQTVWLVIEANHAQTTASLNGRPLGEVAERTEFDVTGRLQAANALCIEVRPPLGEIASVTLQIEEP